MKEYQNAINYDQNIVRFILIVDFQTLEQGLYQEENACMENTFEQTFIGTV